ncbi:MAG: transcription termination/antitermination protein NusG [Campylobacterota bacterium]
MSLQWYAIQAYAGSEQAVKRGIIQLVKDNGIEERLGDIIVPTEDVIDIKDGKKRISERSLYPGYVFVQIDLDTAIWHKIQSLPRVSRFIGEQKKPSPLTKKDIDLILEKANKKSAPKPKIEYEQGEMVRIIDGPFANFNAMVEEYDLEHGKLKLNVSIFGRNTPVEIQYTQVEKII